MPPPARDVRAPGPILVAEEASRVAGALVRHAHEVPDLESVVLFGSSTDGTFDKRSDVDLLFLFEAPDPERTHSDAVLRLLRRVREETGLRREISPVLAPLRRPRLDQDFVEQVGRKGIVVWARPERSLPPARDAERFVLLRWGPSALTPAQRSKIHRTLFGERGRKTVRGRAYEWETPGLIPTDRRYGPGTLFLPQDEAPGVERVLREAGARPRRRRLRIA